MDEDKLKFIRSQVFSMSVSGALSRGRGNPAYKGKISDDIKNNFKVFLKKKLEGYEFIYKKGVSSEQHFKNIDSLKTEINNNYKYKEILNIHFGRAQKLFNLYLKYLWVLDLIEDPPHCPFDSIIISKLKADVSPWYLPRWTRPDFKKEHYKKLVELAEDRSRKKGLSIARWELKFWSENLEKYKDRF